MSDDSEPRRTPTHKGPDANTETEGFLARWSRRKNAGHAAPVETTGSVEDPPLQDKAQDKAMDAPKPESAPQDKTSTQATDADLPPFEMLDEDSDYSAFLSPKVSEALRRQALRKLFRSAQFNVLDGLDDYDDDFRTYEALGDMVTADMRHRMEGEAEKARQSLPNETASGESAEVEPGISGASGQGAEPTLTSATPPADESQATSPHEADTGEGRGAAQESAPPDAPRGPSKPA